MSSTTNVDTSRTEPQPDDEPNGPNRRSGSGRRFEALALPITWVLVVTIFSLLEPDTFFSWTNFTSTLASQAVLLVVTLALVIPLAGGDFDLSVGAVVGLSAIVVATLNVSVDLSLGAALVAALAAGLLIGAINGALIVGVGIDSLVVTLGMSTLVSGITLWVSDARTITGVSSNLIEFVIRRRLFGIAYEFYYGLLLVIFIWYLFEHTPMGQRLTVVGRNREVARLSGIRVGKIRFLSMVASGGIAAFAGILTVGTSGSAGPATGQALLLPAFAAAFLGSTTIRPGRFNPWGTMIAVYFLVTGITGLQLLGGESYVQNLFYGTALIAAVAFSQIIKRRRGETG